MKMRVKVAIIGAVTGLVLLAFTAGSLFADPPTPPPGATLTHEQMDTMMDTIHGEGTSQRMHEAMGPDGEKLMEQCVSMMNMMQGMQGMQGMMGGQNGQSMMGRVMGR